MAVVNGKPVKEYLAADDPFGFGEMMAHDLGRVQKRESRIRKLKGEISAAFRQRIDDVLATSMAANMDLRTLAEGILYAVGYHKHHRGDWRMKRELKQLSGMIDTLKGQLAKPGPVVRYDAPKDTHGAVELFAKAREGEATAVDQVRKMIREKQWTDWIGDLGRQATRQLIHSVAGGDAVWVTGITEKVAAMMNELQGDNPTVLEELLVRRVVNGWVAVHALELELTIRPPIDPRSKEHLDRAMTRAQKRMAEAIQELARVRRLLAPKLLTQVNVVAKNTLVNAGGTVPVKPPKLPAKS